MVAEIASVVTCAVDQGGLAAAQKLHAHQVHAGLFGHPAIMTDLALRIDDRNVEPRIIRSIPGGPYDCPDPAIDEAHAEGRGRLDCGWREAMRDVDFAIEAMLRCPF